MESKTQARLFDATITLKSNGKETSKKICGTQDDIDLELSRLDLLEGIEVVAVDIKPVEQEKPKTHGTTSCPN